MSKKVRGLLLGITPVGRDADVVRILKKKGYIKDIRITYGMYDFIAVLEANNMDEYMKSLKEIERLAVDDGPIAYLRTLPVREYRKK